MATLTINIPDEYIEELKRRAAGEGLSVDEFVLRETGLTTVGPPSEEFWDRLKNLPHVDLGMSSADLIQESREERDRQLDEWLSSR
jgi:plasmid stability protein